MVVIWNQLPALARVALVVGGALGVYEGAKH